MSSRVDFTAVTCQFARLENGRAVLSFSDDQELIIPRRVLPRDAALGQILELHIHTPETAHRHREDLARAVLKEILNG